MTRWLYIGFLTLVLIIAASIALTHGGQNPNPLGKVHQNIVTDYPNISHISRADLQKRLKAPDTLILDTRPLTEYDVSQIPGALQINPNIDIKSFHAAYGPLIKGKKVIVYCSVGRRSSMLGERLQQTAIEAGALSVENMEGGIFGWHNDKRPLENANGATTSIHPYDAIWGRLIENKGGISYKAEK